ncbi:probable glycerol-3-phosphate acyltransferase 3 [Malania oleifera]|uniref:probable glycerol-3-phosphate acyltransferase 3 n=1 Tax=Malania oleifera TaxID=397392 RepID=UPI0025AE6E77|nr:probable glycerol-3-phosphate acyltransferase 3 [Malania oleifera]
MSTAKAFSFFKTPLFFFFFFFPRILHKQLRSLKHFHRSLSNVHAPHSNNIKLQRYSSLAHHRSDPSDQTLVFDVEAALLKSSSLFPYFMLVAFEAGSLLRALVLFLLYPFVCLVSEEMGIKIMVMVCFLGIEKESFRAGRAVLPKFFLQDVGYEGFEGVRRFGKKVGVSNLPVVMVESFLRDYLEIDFVVGRELKVFYGYFLGVMEEKREDCVFDLEEIVGGKEKGRISIHDDVIGICGFNNKSLDHQLFSYCKEIYLINETEKRNWHVLPTEDYPKPLIFHDGRLALRPTPSATLALFMWFPLGVVLAIFRALVALSLSRKASLPILAFTGLRLRFTKALLNPIKTHEDHIRSPKGRGILYVCNHRTLLDPLYLSFTLNKNITAVTYSLSRLSELLAPIKTFRLRRNRDQDAQMMEKLLGEGDLVVCPEGTTCREPYILRFSPLFSEISEEIVPVAMDSHVCMFHGTTAGGLKCFDPLFFLMNPSPSYTVRLLDRTSGSSTYLDHGDHRHNHHESRFDVANLVQSEIGKALGFECTKLTRKDKYMILAGNEGIAASSTNGELRKNGS